MTKLLDKALEIARALPPAAQDEIARTILDMTGNEDAPERVPAEHVAAVLEGLSQTASGTMASDAQVEAALRRFEK